MITLFCVILFVILPLVQKIVIKDENYILRGIIVVTTVRHSSGQGFSGLRSVRIIGGRLQYYDMGFNKIDISTISYIVLA